jgi:Lrp/AsnC family leucine-responsive transcriptional regulator
MAPNYDYLLDDAGWRILSELQKDAGVSYREIGERIGLSGAAIAERVKKMKEAGIIIETRIELNYEKLGLPVTAFIKVNAVGERKNQLEVFIETLPNVLEIHRVVGGESIMLKIALKALPVLEELRQQLEPYGAVYPSIVLTSTYRKSLPKELLGVLSLTIAGLTF